MKKTLATITLALASLTVFGQGRVTFNNLGVGDSTLAVTVGANSAAGQGTTGQAVGSTYTAALLWAPQATYANEAAFLAAVVGSSGSTAFFGTTGGSATTDGAGLFDAGTVPNPVGTSMPAGSYTMQAEAWWNPTGTSTFDQASNGGSNVGRSQLFNIDATVFPAPANTTAFSAFTVQAVPEPSVLALSGLGAAALMLIRRKK